MYLLLMTRRLPQIRDPQHQGATWTLMSRPLCSEQGHFANAYQNAGLYLLRQVAKGERMIDDHQSLCAEQYISYRP
jgi:hypothetical protein